MEFKKLKKDAAAIADGQWVKNIPEMGDLELMVRGFGCVQYASQKSRKEMSVPRGDRDPKTGAISEDDMMRISSELLHEVILLDWRNMTNDGKPQPYDKALAEELLTNLDYSDFAGAVLWASDRVNSGFIGAKEDMGKPVQTESNGKSAETAN